MARELRIYSKSNIYHLILRGVAQQVIFYDDNDRYAYINRLERYSGIDFRVDAYTLMDNHIHLLAYSTDISLYMKKVNISFVSWYNKKYSRVGHLYQNRFLSEPIEDECYYKRCLRYILRNPVKAGICSDPLDYLWSSCNSYFNERKSFINTELTESMFESTHEFKEYIRDNENGLFIKNEEWKFGGNKLERIIESEIEGESIYNLNKDSKLSLALKIISQYRVHKNHLSKLLGLPYKIINSL